MRSYSADPHLLRKLIYIESFNHFKIMVQNFELP